MKLTQILYRMSQEKHKMTMHVTKLSCDKIIGFRLMMCNDV